MSFVLRTGRKVVTTGGTAAVLGANVCEEVIISAETDNTGIIVIGGAEVVASLSTRQGVPLSAGESITVTASNLSEIYIDATVNGEGVTYTYIKDIKGV